MRFHPCSDYRPQTGQVETLEAISNQRVGTYQPEGLGGPFEEEMGGTPPGAFNPPHWGDRPPRDNEEQEFHDLLGDTRFRTLRQRCLVLEQMLKWDLPIPWKESNVRELLNRLRAQEVTPHKLQLCWDTLRWFARQGSLLQWYSQPGKPKSHLKKSFGPWKKGLQGCPFFPELIARRKKEHMPQENWTPSSWGLSATRWAAPPDSMTFSTRRHPL